VRLKNNMLENMFLTVIKMSATAAVIAVIVILLRQLAGRKLPGTFRYAAWAIVLIRLLVPFSIQSDFSLFNIIESPSIAIDRAMSPDEPGDGSTSHGIVDAEGKDKRNNAVSNETEFNPNENTYIKNEENRLNIDAEVNTYTDEVRPSVKATPISVAAYIWMLVSLILLAFCIYAYLKMSGRFKTAVLFDDNGLVCECCGKLNLKRKINVYISDRIDTPVVAGIIRARIILPAFLADNYNNNDLGYVITHELVHIKRHDNITKLLAVLALCIHWFNPLMWLSFLLYQKDMEMSCDARVLSTYENDIRSDYAKSLLNLAVRQSTLLRGGVLAFGESNIKDRIKGIMKFRKNGVLLGIIAVFLLAVFGFVLLTNGQNDITDKRKPAVIDDKTTSSLLEHRNRYIGNASNVGNLLNKLPYGKNKEGIELDTDKEPYGITINYRLEDIKASDEDTMKNVEPTLQDNALILFSLIENVDTVKFNILPSNIVVQFERTQLQQYFEKELWEYSNSKEDFEDFLLDIYFEIFIYPEKYSLALSTVPGMQILIALNAEYYYDAAYSVNYLTENGSLLTWNVSTGQITDHGKSLDFAFASAEPVYWSPPDMEETVGENVITISILSKDGDIIIEKHIRIEKEDAYSYRVKPSYDIIVDN